MGGVILKYIFEETKPNTNMKKALLTLMAILAITIVRAQNIEVVNNTGCSVMVSLRGYDASGKVAALSTSYLFVPPTTTLYLTPSTTWFYLSGVPFTWGFGLVTVTNQSNGYEPGAVVVDPTIVSGTIATTWFNPTCSVTLNLVWVPAAVSSTGNAQLTIN